jgi:DNA polymerase I-like protein with 3'-5' exonuclease and polymerase domains
VKLVTIDFETYYDQEYSLRKMSTEEYVRDPRFEVMGVAVKVDRGATQWFSGDEKATRGFLESLWLGGCAILAHNMVFDGLILAERFGIYPAMYLDTMLMANAEIKPFTGRVSLAKCLEHLNLGTKGDEVHNMLGRHRQSLSPEEMRRYGAYCKNDVDTTFTLFQHLADGFPRRELQLIDLTLRMYLQPKFELDATLLAEHLQEVKAKKDAAQARVTAAVTVDDLMSNAKFAEILKRIGVDVPMKISPATGKPTYALAKNDLAFKEFAEEYQDDPLVGPLLLARLATKSTLEETRTDRLLSMARRSWLLRVPLSYYAAHTGRYGGSESINLQNLPQPHKSKIRFGLRAPRGYVVLGADLSQIEARCAAEFAGERSLTDAFRAGRDVYSEFGSRLYGRTITRADKRERFLSKTAVLGLQYGMGPGKFISAARAMGDVKVTAAESEGIVQTYRSVYTAIPRCWRALDKVLEQMVLGGTGAVGPCTFTRYAIRRPNGMHLRYPNLEYDNGNYQYTYGPMVRTLWGGKLLENLIQALARDIVMENMLRIRDEVGIRPALQVHDELDYIVPEKDAEAVAAAIRRIMTAPPAWMPGLPVDVEIHWGETFGDCK